MQTPEYILAASSDAGRASRATVCAGMRRTRDAVIMIPTPVTRIIGMGVFASQTAGNYHGRQDAL